MPQIGCGFGPADSRHIYFIDSRLTVEGFGYVFHGCQDLRFAEKDQPFQFSLTLGRQGILQQIFQFGFVQSVGIVNQDDGDLVFLKNIGRV